MTPAHVVAGKSIRSVMDSKIKLGKSKIQGRGVLSSKNIRRGEIICQLDGKEISIRQLIRVYKVKLRDTDPLQVGDTKYLDLNKPYIYINHSCNPNAAIVRYNDLIAIKNIKEGEEITFDYSANEWQNVQAWQDWPGFWKIKCRCGYAKCRKVIQDWAFMPKAWQKKYIKNKWVQDYILKRYSRLSK